MKLAQVAVMAESGELLWDGSLTSFLHANNDYPNEFTVRDGINTPHGRPEPIGKGKDRTDFLRGELERIATAARAAIAKAKGEA